MASQEAPPDFRYAARMAIKIARSRMGWTQPDLVEHLDAVNWKVTRPTISDWERGDGMPGADDLIAVLFVAGLKLEEVLQLQARTSRLERLRGVNEVDERVFGGENGAN